MTFARCSLPLAVQDTQSASRAWKLFLLAPRMLPAWPEQQGSHGRALMLARAAAFQRGDQRQLLAAARPVERGICSRAANGARPCCCVQTPSLSANGHAPKSDRASLPAPGRYSRQPSSCAGHRGLLGRAHRPHEAPARGGRPLSCFNTNPKPKEARQASKQGNKNRQASNSKQEGRQAVRPAQARPGKARFKMQCKAGQGRAGKAGRQPQGRACAASTCSLSPQAGGQAHGRTACSILKWVDKPLGKLKLAGRRGGNMRREYSARGAARLKHALARNFEGRFPKWGCA